MGKCQNFIQKIRENPFANKKSVTMEKNIETGEMKRRDSASVQTKMKSDQTVTLNTKPRIFRPAELVSKFYKYVGLLPSKRQLNNIDVSIDNVDTPPSFQDNPNNFKSYKANFKYEPKDFSINSKVGLGLMMNASLGDEQIIMFDEKDIQLRMSNIKNQLDQQSEVKNMKTVEKIQDQLPMSIIREEEIEQTIALK